MGGLLFSEKKKKWMGGRGSVVEGSGKRERMVRKCDLENNLIKNLTLLLKISIKRMT